MVVILFELKKRPEEMLPGCSSGKNQSEVEGCAKG